MSFLELTFQNSYSKFIFFIGMLELSIKIICLITYIA